MLALCGSLVFFDLCISAFKTPYQVGSFVLLPVLYGILGIVAGCLRSRSRWPILLAVPLLTRGFGFVFINNQGLKDPSAAFSSFSWAYFFALPLGLYGGAMFLGMIFRPDKKT